LITSKILWIVLDNLYNEQVIHRSIHRKCV